MENKENGLDIADIADMMNFKNGDSELTHMLELLAKILISNSNDSKINDRLNELEKKVARLEGQMSMIM